MINWLLRTTMMLACIGLPAFADAPLIIIDRSQLPFELGPGHPANSPSKQSNSPHNSWNSAGNTANSSGVWKNKATNPDNGKRLIITADGGVLGYYASNAGGALNLYDVNGRRIAYRPAKGTASLFTTNGEWCGTVDNNRGGFVLAVTRNCASKFGQ